MNASPPNDRAHKLIRIELFSVGTPHTPFNGYTLNSSPSSFYFVCSCVFHFHFQFFFLVMDLRCDVRGNGFGATFPWTIFYGSERKAHKKKTMKKNDRLLYLTQKVYMGSWKWEPTKTTSPLLSSTSTTSSSVGCQRTTERSAKEQIGRWAMSVYVRAVNVVSFINAMLSDTGGKK